MIDSKIDQYDPEKGFVIVLQASGLTGVDIVQPSMPPKVIHRLSSVKRSWVRL